MFDYYEKGYNDGFNHAKVGKSKNYAKGIPILSSLVTSKAVDTYIEGYDSGYREGQKKKYH